MPDHKPPRLAADERETLLALLRFQRASMLRKVEGVSEADARRSVVPSGTSLAWLVAHLASAESSWVEQRFAGATSLPAPLVEDPPPLHEAVATYEVTAERVDAIVAVSSLEDRCRADDVTPAVNLRWVLAHLLEETARHAGHADVLRELLDGTTGR